jgi:hypothetical protein
MPLEGRLMMSHKQPGLYLEAVPPNTHWQTHIGDLRDENGNVWVTRSDERCLMPDEREQKTYTNQWC